MLARTGSSIPRPVVPPKMMTRPLGAILANVPQGDAPSSVGLKAPLPPSLSPLPFELLA